MPHAPAPSRSTTKLTLTLGMIPLAIDVFSAVEDSNVGRKQFIKADDGVLHPVGTTTFDKITGTNVDRADLLLMVETPDGEYVEVKDEEMQALLTSENGDCTFIGFIPEAEYRRTYIAEKPYQVRPQKVKAGKNPYDKPFALFMEAMAHSSVVGLFSYVARGKTKYAALHSNGTMNTIYFTDEVRESRALPDVPLSDAEIAMAQTLIDQMTLIEAPDFQDEDSAKIMGYAVEKGATLAAGGEVALPVALAVEKGDPGQDLMAMLSASIQASAR